MAIFLVIGICLLAGMGLRRFSEFPENTGEVLNLYVIWIALPAVVLYHIPQLQLNIEALYPFVFAWGLLIIVAVLLIVLSRVLQWSQQVTCALLILTPLGNTSFVGFPLVEALLGKEALGYAILYDQTGSFLGLVIYATVVLAVLGGVRTRPVEVVSKIILFPPFIALLLGLLLGQIGVPLALNQALAVVATTLVPVVMVAVGYQWQFRLATEFQGPLLVGLLIKCVLMPALAWLGISQLSLTPLLEHTIVLEAGMAPMISAGALVMSHHQARPLASAMVGYGLLLSFITVPVWHWLIV
ncbi:AEC family transporter [Marinicella sp. W31]|uniref:AEC family transporter n=1 Tax=Marinicella sp. W31 TaxID=3023713 RepID=UPI00375754A6